MSEYIISEDGCLQRKEYKHIDTGKEYTPSWSKNGKLKFPVIEHEFIGYSDILHHGVLNFCNSIREPNREHFSRWLEFDAFFSYGKLDKIVIVKNELQNNTGSDLQLKEFFDKHKERNSKWHFKLVDWVKDKVFRARNKIRGFLYWLARKV